MFHNGNDVLLLSASEQTHCILAVCNSECVIVALHGTFVLISTVVVYLQSRDPRHVQTKNKLILTHQLHPSHYYENTIQCTSIQDGFSIHPTSTINPLHYYENTIQCTSIQDGFSIHPTSTINPLHYYENTIQCTSIQDGFYALRKAHTHSTPALRSFPNVAFEMVPLFLWLTLALSHPFREDCLALPLFTSLSTLHYKRPSPVQPSPSPSVPPQRKHRLQWSLFPPGLHLTCS